VSRKIPKPFHQLSTRVGDYRLLGLAWGESDIVKIRASVTSSAGGAARKKATPSHLHAGGLLAGGLLARGPHDVTDRRTKAALAGYRLLDPRFRRQLYDRVQLSYLIYRELDEQPRDKDSNDRLPLIMEKPLNSLMTPDDQTKTEPMVLSMGLDCANVYPIAPEASLYGSEETTFSSLDDAREIVRLLNESEHHVRTRTSNVSRWLRLARKVGSFCRRVC